MRVGWTLGVVAALVGVAGGEARAGRTHYGWLYGTEVMPEGGVELQVITAEQNHYRPGNVQDTTWWTGVIVGVTDHLELALPFELLWRDSDATGKFATTRYYGVEGRYRFVTSDPEHAPAFVPLLRFAVKRDIVDRDSVRPEADLVLSYERGRFHAAVDVGYVGEIERHETHVELRPSAGVSIRVAGELRLGAETYAELSLDSQRKSFAYVGPNAAWTKGRFWLSAGLGFGVYRISTAPRFTWGVAF